MAKQDLVVKLMLESGAFGKDIREAERKAQDFSNKMQNAGKTAGAFGKEIGLSAGALGKLGGVLSGAGGAIAAVGAFKNIMESSGGTARQFGGIVEGCKSVVDNFQTAIATFDFSNFNEGLLTVIKNGKKYKEAIIDMQQGDVGYDFLKTDYSERLKALEVKYKDPKTTDAERKLIETERDELLKKWSEDAAGNLNLHLNAFLTSIKNKEKDINTDLLDLDTVMELIGEASRDFNANRDEEIVKSWKKKSKEINKARREWKRVERYRDAITAGTQMGDIVSVSAETDELEAKYEKLKSDYQTLMIKATIFDKYKPDELQQLYTLLTSAKKQNEEVSAKTSEVMGWSAPSASTKTSGSNGKATSVSTVGATHPEIKNMEGSIGKIKEDIAEAKKIRDSYLLGSDAWSEEAAKVASLERQLKLMEGEMDKLLSKYKMEKLPELPDLIDQWTENAKNKNNGLAVPKGYKREGGLIVKDVKAPDINVDKIVDELDTMNSALSSSIMLVNGLGAAFASCEDETAQQLAGVSDIVGSVMAGIMSLTQIQQSAIATNNAYALSVATGQAASLPFPANLAAIATVVGTLISVFATIKQMSNNKFAEGGIVGGTSYSGDKLFAMVNSGEMILNKRQQRNLSNMIGGGGGQVEFHISGDSLVGVLNNKRHKTNLTR